MSAPALREVGDLADRLVGRGAQQAGPCEQHLAHGVKPDATAIALEQRAAECRLQPLDALGQRGLGAAELFTGLPHVPQRGHGLEVLQVAKLQVHGVLMNRRNQWMTIIDWTE